MEIKEIGLLTVKAETTYNTDPTPTLAANIIPVLRDSLTYEVASDPEERALLDGSMDKVPGFNTRARVTLKFTYELRGNYRNGGTQLDITNGTSTQKVEIDALLAACDLLATYTAAGTPGSEGSSAGSRDGYVTYTPYAPASLTAPGPSVTCYFYTKLKLHKLTGGKVDATFRFAAGKIVAIDFTVMGNYVAVADNTFSTSGAAYLDVKPPTFDGATVTIGSYAPVMESLTFSLGNNIVMRPDALSTNGVAGFIITSRNPKGTCNPESVTEAANAFWADWKASTVRAITALVGSTAGNKVQVTLSAEYKSVNYGDRDKTRIHEVQFDIVRATLGGTIGSQLQIKFF